MIDRISDQRVAAAAAIDDMLLSAEFAVNPYPTLAFMRQHDPVHWFEPWQCWMVTRYEDVSRVVSDDEYFSDRNRNFQLSVLKDQDNVPLTLLTSDPPEHTRLRKAVSREFTPKAVATTRELVTEYVTQILDQIDPSAVFDFGRDLARAVPMYVVPNILGVDPSRIPQELGDDTTKIMDLLGVAPDSDFARDVLKQVAQSQVANDDAPAPLAELFVDQLDNGETGVATQCTRGSVVTSLAQARAQGALSSEEAYAYASMLLSAGIDTTRVFMTSSLALLLQHPTELAKLRSDPSLLRSALEECLRLEPPIQRIPRRLTQDITLGGRTLHAGSTPGGAPEGPTVVMAMTASANRDATVFENADAFDIERYADPSTPQHLVFGLGRHSCLGQRLARLEAEIAIGGLLERFSEIRLTDEPLNWLPRYEFRTLESLRVRLSI